MRDGKAVSRSGGKSKRSTRGEKLRAALADKGNRDIADDLQARSTDFVDRVVLGVPGGLVEVDHIDGSNSSFLELEMVVDQRVAG